MVALPIDDEGGIIFFDVDAARGRRPKPIEASKTMVSYVRNTSTPAVRFASTVALVYRTRFFGQAVGLCGAPERLVMPSGASVVRASMAVLVDQPFGVVAGGEGADGVSD